MLGSNRKKIVRKILKNAPIPALGYGASEGRKEMKVGHVEPLVATKEHVTSYEGHVLLRSDQ